MKYMRYTDSDGSKWVVIAPDRVTDNLSAYPVAGPPDLSELGLSKEQTRKLQNGLVDMGAYDAPTLTGKRKQLVSLVLSLGLERSIFQEVTRLFQRDYYGE